MKVFFFAEGDTRTGGEHPVYHAFKEGSRGFNGLRVGGLCIVLFWLSFEVSCVSVRRIVAEIQALLYLGNRLTSKSPTSTTEQGGNRVS